MSKKMLIDATHAEATRVVVLDNGRLDELDVDTSTKKQIKGNIYLAKVIRVEPSLQAAFVDYGGNRHGFLAFGEIHPDYYQIPTADREKLKEMMATSQAEKQEDLEEDRAPQKGRAAKAASHHDEEVIESSQEPLLDEDHEETHPMEDETAESHPKTSLEVVSEAETEEVAPKRPTFFKRYKIQEVIRQGQVMLIQVVKEERGNKGAALTTYLSLAGRYSVLMPNNGKGGGVSRKITNAKERKEMRAIVDSLPIPQGMSVIVRTAGSGKKKAEIKRDYDYLIKTWMKIRDNTLESMAPKLIHEEGDIIKRSLRDGFTPDIEEIWVEGDTTFKNTKEFMKILMPGQVKKIKQYKGDMPMFQTYQVENQLEAIHNNVVQLKSGGYLVIDQTEALVAVDVNSGRATKERDIEETALRTNLETCDELARQLKLRDLAGLIVIDFIDMDEAKNNSAVERRLKEALKKDRARIQVGKISGFGLMEMSRQRLHSSFLESSYKVCSCCGGKGVVRLVESCATRVMYLLEDAANRYNNTTLVMSLPMEVATYVLNQKRDNLSRLETKYNVLIQILGDSTLEKSTDYRLERLRENGEKSPVQPVHPTHNAKDQKEKFDRKNKGNKETAKTDEPKNTPSAATVSSKVEDTAPQAESPEDTAEAAEKNNRRRDRNRRRREWKKNKRLARKAAGETQGHDDASPSQADEKLPGAALVVPDEHLPTIVEDGHKAVVAAEEHFTVVEQSSLGDVEQPQEPKKGRGRKPKVKKEDIKGSHTAPQTVRDAAPRISEQAEKTADVTAGQEGSDATENSPQEGLNKRATRGRKKTPKATDANETATPELSGTADEKPSRMTERVSQPNNNDPQSTPVSNPEAVQASKPEKPAKKRGGWWNKLVS